MARHGRIDRGRRTASGIKQLPWLRLVNPYRPVEVLDEEALQRIHDASMQILEELGLEILSEEALARFTAAGARVDRESRRVRLDRDLVLEHVALAPKRFTLHSRNPERRLTVGAPHVNFCVVSSAPNCSDLDRGRRPGNFADFANLLRLAQSLNIVHIVAGYPTEPIDLPPETRHLDCHYLHLTETDKVFGPYALGRVRVADAVEMYRIARGLTEDEVIAEPGLVTVVNTNSPLRVDGPMLDGLSEMARWGQAVIVTPFTLSGAMSPATLAGALAQQNAEALGVIAYSQMVRPGAPVVYGGFTSNVDMRTGAPAFGTPEYAKAALAGGQLARRYGLPYRSSNACAANAVDAQAAYESEMSVWAAVMGHASIIKHGLGWMEGGLVASYEKVILDAEILQGLAEFLRPLEVTDETLGLDAIREVGPGGHFFGAAHTLARYETAFYEPLLSDWRNFESWREGGAKTAVERANLLWKKVLAEFVAPPVDVAVADALKDYVERRKREIARTAA